MIYDLSAGTWFLCVDVQKKLIKKLLRFFYPGNAVLIKRLKTPPDQLMKIIT